MGEGSGRTARMHVGEESHRGVVPMNPTNQGGRSPAEKGEGRPRHKENTYPPYTPPTQRGIWRDPTVGGRAALAVAIIRVKSRMR